MFPHISHFGHTIELTSCYVPACLDGYAVQYETATMYHQYITEQVQTTTGIKQMELSILPFWYLNLLRFDTYKISDATQNFGATLFWLILPLRMLIIIGTENNA